MKKIKIVFFGSDPWSIHVLKALEDNFDVKAVVCAPDSPVAHYFRGSVLTPEKLDSDFLTSLSRAKSRDDLFVVASYGKIIPKSILEIPKYGALNVHPSLLPKYRGPSPVPATILNGDKETGVTIMKMDEKMDHGPIVFTKEIKLSGREDLQELINKLFQLGAEGLVDIIPDFIRGKVKLLEQQHARAIYCPLIKKEDGYFDISSPPDPEKLDRMIRAYYPWPGVWTRWNNKVVKFLPGVIPTKAGIQLKTSRSELDSRIRGNDNFFIQMEGKKSMGLKDFLNGYPDFPIKSITVDKK